MDKKRIVRIAAVVLAFAAIYVCGQFPDEGGTQAVSAAERDRITKVSGFKVVKASSGSVKITWKKQKGVSGYQVYRKQGENGKYRKIITTKKPSAVIRKPAAGKTCSYKVRAYKKADGKIRYGAFSRVKRIVVEKSPVAGSEEKAAEAPREDMTPAGDAEKSHKHEWVPVYGERTVYKPEKKVYSAICNQCSLDMSSFTEDEIWEHILGTDCGSFSTDVCVEVMTEQIETYICRYQCRCGAERQ